MLVAAYLCSSAFLFLLWRLRMAFGEELGRKTGTVVAEAWSQVSLQEFADKAVE